MWRQRELSVLDHEKCFAYLTRNTDPQRPWREFLQNRPLQRHCLRPPDPPLDDPQFARGFQEELIGLEFNNQVPQIVTSVRAAFPEAGVALDQILHYFDQLSNNRQDFFEYLRFALR